MGLFKPKRMMGVVNIHMGNAVNIGARNAVNMHVGNAVNMCVGNAVKMHVGNAVKIHAGNAVNMYEELLLTAIPARLVVQGLNRRGMRTTSQPYADRREGEREGRALFLDVGF